MVAQNLFLECEGACTTDGLRGPVADVNILDVDFYLRGGQIAPSCPREKFGVRSETLARAIFAHRGEWLR